MTPDTLAADALKTDTAALLLAVDGLRAVTPGDAQGDALRMKRLAGLMQHYTPGRMTPRRAGEVLDAAGVRRYTGGYTTLDAIRRRRSTLERQAGRKPVGEDDTPAAALRRCYAPARADAFVPAAEIRQRLAEAGHPMNPRATLGHIVKAVSPHSRHRQQRQPDGSRAYVYSHLLRLAMLAPSVTGDFLEIGHLSDSKKIAAGYSPMPPELGR